MDFQYVLVDREPSPDGNDELLRGYLGDTFELFAQLRARSADLIQEWKYYGKKYGWSFKASRKKKAMFYATVLKDCFLVGMALRQEERDTLLQSGVLPDELQAEFEAADKIMEGYPLRKTVETKDDLGLVLRVLEAVRRL